MKFAMLAMMATAVALAPIAHAQDCSTLYSVLSSGQKDDFEGIFNGEVDDGVFEATLTFAKADACEVDSYEPIYYCRWEANSAADADKAILPLYDMAKVCLSGGWEWDDLAGTKSRFGTKILEGYSMRKTSGEYRDAVVWVYMHAESAGDARQVLLEVEPY